MKGWAWQNQMSYREISVEAFVVGFFPKNLTLGNTRLRVCMLRALHTEMKQLPKSAIGYDSRWLFRITVCSGKKKCDRVQTEPTTETFSFCVILGDCLLGAW